MFRSVVVTILALLLIAAAAQAATDAEKCEAKKLKHSAVYAACRLKAEAKTKGVAPDYAKCASSFATKFGKAEEKAGVGVCPTEGDQALIEQEVAGSTQEIAG